jgi:hypothetical protein
VILFDGSHERSGPCHDCKAVGYCAADCGLAPWNFAGDENWGQPLPGTNRFGYYRRKVRWVIDMAGGGSTRAPWYVHFKEDR